MQDKYITLISSLPPHTPGLFATKQPPISRLKLDERLQMLEPEDTNDLALIENLVHWDRIPIETTDAEMIRRGERARDQLSNEFIKDIIRWRLELRTAVAALRLRQIQKRLPTYAKKWEYGRWIPFIEKHWHESAFALGKIFTWLPDAERFLQEKNYLALERLLLAQSWEHYSRVAEDHYFDFEAVVIYVLRWDVIDRWSRYNVEKARKRFVEMTDTALGDYTKMFA
jgi:uncharacterized protein DUF2764